MTTTGLITAPSSASRRVCQLVPRGAQAGFPPRHRVLVATLVRHLPVLAAIGLARGEDARPGRAPFGRLTGARPAWGE